MKYYVLYKNINNASGSWGYQSWKQLLHIACPQLGKTILVQFSMHIPHSSSLSRSLSERFLLSSTLFLVKISVDWLLEVLSSNSMNSPSSCLREGYITAARNFTLNPFRSWEQKIWRPGNWMVVNKKPQRRTDHKIRVRLLSFLLRTLLAFHQRIPIQLSRASTAMQKL